MTSIFKYKIIIALVITFLAVAIISAGLFFKKHTYNHSQNNLVDVLDGRPQSTEQVYAFTCGINKFMINFATFADLEKPPTSELLSIKVNNFKPSNHNALQELYGIFPKLTGLELPPMALCEGSSARLGIKSYWSGAVEPQRVYLLLYFHEDGKITYIFDKEFRETPN